jgi:hypothetical protein
MSTMSTMSTMSNVESNMDSKDLAPPFQKVDSKDLAPPLQKVDLEKVDVKVVVEALGCKYSFDAEEALRWLSEENICELSTSKSKSKSNVKKSKSKSKSNDLAPRLSKVEEKRKYPLPFNGLKNDNCCNGIVKNHGLYTQCEKKLPKDGMYCKGCELEPYGNIEDRLKVDLYEYKDPKGKCPIRYTEVLKKLKISKEMIEEESKRLKITINEVHFEEVTSENVVKRGRPKSEKVKESKSTGKKGRPKKETKKVEVTNYSEEEDLFATLLANISLENEYLENQGLENVEPNEENEKVYEEKSKLAPKELVEDLKKQRKAEEKAAKEAAKEAEKQKKAEEKAAKEAAKEAEKQKKAEEKATKEAAKESKKKTAKVESKKKSNETSKDLAPPLEKVEKKSKKVKEADPAKEAEKLKKAEEKAAKEAEKQKKADEKAAKEAEKLKKAEEKAAKALAPPLPKVDKKKSKVLAPPLPKVEEEADVVRKFEHEGKSYYKSKNSGVIYNMEQEVVGKWNEERKEIDFEEEEEEEEEYDD